MILYKRKYFRSVIFHGLPKKGEKKESISCLFLVGREIISLSKKVEEQEHKLLVILNSMSHRNSLSYICAQKGEMLTVKRLPLHIESCIIYIVIVLPFFCSTLFIFNSFLHCFNYCFSNIVLYVILDVYPFFHFFLYFSV